jgi:hypothetical protein
MKAYEFPAEVTAEGMVVLPNEVLTHLSSLQQVRVIVLVDESADLRERSEWSKLSAERFVAGYSASDAIYDTL